MRRGGGDVERLVVHDDDVIDELPLWLHHEILAGADAFDVPLDGVGVQRLAILEGEPRPQMKPPREVVDLFPTLGRLSDVAIAIGGAPD